MPRISSSAITWAEYNKTSGELTLTFTSGNNYTYHGVPPEIYAQFIDAPSQGKFFNQFIKDRYDFS